MKKKSIPKTKTTTKISGKSKSLGGKTVHKLSSLKPPAVNKWFTFGLPKSLLPKKVSAPKPIIDELKSSIIKTSFEISKEDTFNSSEESASSARFTINKVILSRSIIAHN